MRARGFWGGDHYWCKVIRTVGGLTGVWYHNDMLNGGIAQFVSSDVETIGGPSPNTSWVMYSRAPTTEESLIIKAADTQIDRAVGSKVIVDRPFSQMEVEVDKEEEGVSEGGNDSDIEMVKYKSSKELKEIFASDDSFTVKVKPNQARRKTNNVKYKNSKELADLFASDDSASDAPASEAPPLAKVHPKQAPRKSKNHVKEDTLAKVKPKPKQVPRKNRVKDKMLPSDKGHTEDKAPLAKKPKREEVFPSDNGHAEDKAPLAKKPKRGAQVFTTICSHLMTYFFHLIVARDESNTGREEIVNVKKKSKWKGWHILKEGEEISPKDNTLPVGNDSSQEGDTGGRRVSKRTKRKRE
ncbi:uncharacterized protein MELLADRAFT_89394 [Melampsora larici-populina 98AG31]|uniref:Uncharacterized protein n=1 Tax=Melampsora larici-populina (strain 98AG31 / pathotype 3-4-7) TaxID=747676 RepID=F4R613_MELLP|nr:uncharacterized protein MELLADRAFT_89394 [Melampsora larici-populina 98AG31]EGG12139.1 hypothetical protein MELLADRAFT_89394 [Melampsora larici-populina 98AG31]